MLYLKVNLKSLFINVILFCSVFGQTKEDALIIQVFDQLKNPVSSAKVILTSDTKKFSQIKNTNTKGIAIFENLPESDFNIFVKADGFSDYEKKSLPFEKNIIQVTLEILPIEAKVVIDNSEETQKSYGNINTLTVEQIDNLPIDSEELEKALQRIAGESVTGELLPINVNGIDNSKLPNKEDIKSITIYREIFSAQFEGTSGERIEIETKSSRAKFGGGLIGKFGNSIINARDAFISEKSPLNLGEFSLDLHGPINNKISWSLYTEFSNLDTGSAINAIKLNSALQPIQLKTFQTVPRRYRYSGLTIDANPTEKSKVNLRYSYQSTTNKNLGVGGFTLQNRGYNTENQTNSVNFNSIYVFNPNFFNSAKGSVTFSSNKLLSSGNSIGVSVLDSFTDGALGTSRKSDIFRAVFFDDVSLTLKKVRIGFGFMLRSNRNSENSNVSNATYFFNGRNAPILDANNVPVSDPQGNFINQSITSLESYRRTLFFTQVGFSPTQVRSFGGGANQLTISSGNSDIFATQTDFATYLQIAFPIKKNLAGSFGVRYENQTNIKSNSDFSPRFGLIWSPKSEKQTKPIFSLPKVSVGFGWFYSRFGIENLFNSKRTINSSTNNFTITNSSLLDSFPNIPTITNIQQSSIGRSTLTIDEKLKSPFQTILNFSLDKNLAKNLSVNIRYSSINSYRQSVTRNINAPLPGTYTETNVTNAIYPFGNRQAVFRVLSAGKNESNRLNLSLNSSDISFLKTKINLGFSYGFAKDQGNVVSGNSNYFNAYNFSDEFSRSTSDGVHRASTWIETSLPKSFNLFIVSNFRTGQRFNFTTGKDSNGDGYYSERPAFASNLNKPGIVFTKFGVFDPNPTLGDEIIPRNFGRGAKLIEINLILTKTFKFGMDKNTKKLKYRSRLNIFVDNLFNTNNLGNPIGNLSSPNFLRSLSVSSIDGLGKLSEPRSIRFAMTFSF